MNAHFSISNHNEIQILQVRDLLNEFNNKEILKAAQAKIEKGFTNFVVDLSKVEYMNSVGLNLLINLKIRSNDSGGKVAVANASQKILQLLEITKLKPMFHLTNSVEEALQRIKSND